MLNIEEWYPSKETKELAELRRVRIALGNSTKEDARIAELEKILLKREQEHEHHRELFLARAEFIDSVLDAVNEYVKKIGG